MSAPGEIRPTNRAHETALVPRGTGPGPARLHLAKNIQIPPDPPPRNPCHPVPAPRAVVTTAPPGVAPVPGTAAIPTGYRRDTDTAQIAEDDVINLKYQILK